MRFELTASHALPVPSREGRVRACFPSVAWASRPCMPRRYNLPSFFHSPTLPPIPSTILAAHQNPGCTSGAQDHQRPPQPTPLIKGLPMHSHIKPITLLFLNLTILTSATSLYAADAPPWATKDLRCGIIGTDT